MPREGSTPHRDRIKPLSVHRDIDNIRENRGRLMEATVDIYEEAVPKLVACFSALVDMEVAKFKSISSAPKEESKRTILEYADRPEEFISRECGVSLRHPVWTYVYPMLEPSRLISRVPSDDPIAVQAAALVSMWFYKCHEFAQVFVRLPRQNRPMQTSFWKPLRNISLANPDIFSEEINSPYGIVNYRRVQRRINVHITNGYPRVFGPNVMFVLGGGTDWYHETARKIYLC